MDIVEKVEAMMKEKGILRQCSTIVVAVSGGVDSMALLHILHRLMQPYELKLIAAHVNHGFRIEESAAEAEMVHRRCQELGITMEMTELHMPDYLQQTKENSQAASRQRRYQFFHDVAARYDASAIALAHHADDQAETVLMHLLRGSGSSGLKGMSFARSEKNVELIRPLLRMRKIELKLFCLQHGIPYLEDSSNQSRDYKRNELRLDIMPQLERYNPQLVASLCRLADIAGEEDTWLQQQTELRFAEIVKKYDSSLSVLCSALNGEPIALQRRLIKLILSYLSDAEEFVSFETIERIRALSREEAKSVSRLDVGAGLICIREYERLRFVHINDYTNSLLMPLKPFNLIPEHMPCELRYGSWIIKACILPKQQRPKLKSKHEALFDAALIDWPVMIRSRQAGDRMQVLGLNGTKKVQDMFVDAKVASSKRDTYPVVVDRNGQLIWIPGIRRSSHGLIHDETESLLYMQCIDIDQ